MIFYGNEHIDFDGNEQIFSDGFVYHLSLTIASNCCS